MIVAVLRASLGYRGVIAFGRQLQFAFRVQQACSYSRLVQQLPGTHTSAIRTHFNQRNFLPFEQRRSRETNYEGCDKGGCTRNEYEVRHFTSVRLGIKPKASKRASKMR